MGSKKIILFFLTYFFLAVRVFSQQEDSKAIAEDRTQWGQQKKAKELYQLGYQEYVCQHYADALELLNESLVLKPNFAEAYIIRGNTKERLDDLQGALVDYEIVLHLQPEYTEARFNRAFTLYKHKRYEKALEDFQYLLEHPSSTETQGVYFKGVNYGEGQERVFTDVMTLDSDVHADLYHYIALCYKGMGNFQEAIQNFNQAIARHPTKPELYINRAMVYEAAGKLVKAVEDYEKTLQLDPSNAAAANNLTALATETGESSRAGQAIDKAIEKDPWAYAAYLNRALLSQQQGKYHEALVDCNKALSLAPERGEIWVQRAFAKEKLDDLSGALSDYTIALKYDAYDVTTFLNRGNVFFKQEAYGQAIDDYNRALRLDANYAKTYYNRALAYHRIGQHENACQDLEKALELGFEGAEKVIEAYCK